MATKNFTQFDLRAPLLTSDYLVGYKDDGSAEIRGQVKDIVDYVAAATNAQTLTFDEVDKDLTISSGNTVSLSALVDSTTDTEVRALTSNWESTYNTFSTTSAFNVQSQSTLETPTTGLSTINNIVSLSQATYDALTVKLPTTLYLIV